MSGDDNVRWSEYPGSKFFDKVEMTINRKIYTSFKSEDGQLVANIEHIGGSEEECLFCKLGSKYKKDKPSDFMYMYGQKHVYNKKTRRWDGYYGGNPVDSIDEEWCDIYDQLSQPRSTGYSKLIGAPED
uniref:Uncharacterized protein n=1 Tax=Marseillevirus LCMAC201 TaxID=2506605 RepID=A0A481YVY3_9VIRU|nr:MAG: hypothetical protein LCMAC201_02520 [Marseillevirus LCMAC201]